MKHGMHKMSKGMGKDAKCVGMCDEVQGPMGKYLGHMRDEKYMKAGHNDMMDFARTLPSRFKRWMRGDSEQSPAEEVQEAAKSREEYRGMDQEHKEFERAIGSEKREDTGKLVRGKHNRQMLGYE